MNHKWLWISAAELALLGSAALGHAGPRIYLAIQNGKIVTYDGPYPPPQDGSGNVITNPAAYGNYAVSRIFPGVPPDETTTGGQPDSGVLPLHWDDDPLNFSTQFPGLSAYPPGLLPAGTSFSYNIMGSVQWYDAASQKFVPIAQALPTNTPFIAVTNGIGNTKFSGTGVVPGDLAFTYNGDPSDHQHLTFTICTPADLADGFDPEDAPAGVYALPLQFTSPQAASPSDTFYVLFGDRGPTLSVSQLDMQNEMQQAISGLPWASASSGLWDTAANWDLPITPQIFHNVSITPSAGLTVTGPAAPTTVNSLTLGSTGGIAQLSLQVGGALTLTANVSINAGGALNTNGANLTTPSLTNAGLLSHQGPGSITVGTFVNTGTYGQTGGSASFGAVSGNGAFNQSGGTVSIGTWGITGAYHLSGGTLALQPAAGAHTLLQVSAGGLTVAAGAKIDLANLDMIITGAAASAALFNMAMAAPKQITNPGNGLPLWVTTGVLAGQEYSKLTGASLLDGVSVGSSDLALRYTLAGDATLDGRISIADYALIDAGFLLGLAPRWSSGDFNHDGVVNYQDYALIDLNFLDQGNATLAGGMVALHAAQFGSGYTAALGADAAAAGVPEPASLSILGMGLLGLLQRHRRVANRRS